jgi:hypothetical protein
MNLEFLNKLSSAIRQTMCGSIHKKGNVRENRSFIFPPLLFTEKYRSNRGGLTLLRKLYGQTSSYLVNGRWTSETCFAAQ